MGSFGTPLSSKTLNKSTQGPRRHYIYTSSLAVRLSFQLLKLSKSNFARYIIVFLWHQPEMLLFNACLCRLLMAIKQLTLNLRATDTHVLLVESLSDFCDTHPARKNNHKEISKYLYCFSKTAMKKDPSKLTCHKRSQELCSDLPKSVIKCQM